MASFGFGIDRRTGVAQAWAILNQDGEGKVSRLRIDELGCE